MKDATRIRNRHVAFLASFQDAGSIFEQLSIIYQMPRMFVSSFTLVLPYFPTGTAERVSMLPPHPSCLIPAPEAVGSLQMWQLRWAFGRWVVWCHELVNETIFKSTNNLVYI